jgi:hypothetical protein
VELLEALAWLEEVERSSEKVGRMEEDGGEDNGLLLAVWPSAQLAVDIKHRRRRGGGFS